MGGSGLSDTKSEQGRGKGKCCKGARGVQVAVSGAATQMQKYVMSPSCCLFRSPSISLSLFLSRIFSVALSPLLTALTGRQDVLQQQQQRRQITTTKCIVCKHVTTNNNNVQQTTIATTTSCIVCCLILRSVNDAEISTLFFAISSNSIPPSLSSTPVPLPLLPLSLLCFPIFFCRPFLVYFIYLFYLPRKSRPLSNNNTNNNNEQRQRQCRRDCGVKP